MIYSEDTEFHHDAAETSHLFAKTNSFCFTLPKHDLMASVYVASRKPLSVMSADIVIYGSLAADRASACT